MREVVADDLVRNRLVLNSGTRSWLKRDRVLCCSLEDGYGRVGEGVASLSQLHAALCLHLRMFIKNLLVC